MCKHIFTIAEPIQQSLITLQKNKVFLMLAPGALFCDNLSIPLEGVSLYWIQKATEHIFTNGEMKKFFLYCFFSLSNEHWDSVKERLSSPYSSKITVNKTTTTTTTL